MSCCAPCSGVLARSFDWDGELDDVLGLPDWPAWCLRDTAERLREARIRLAMRDGPIVALITDWLEAVRFVTERTLSIDITAAGGNVALLAAGDDAA